ncbi:MAG: L-ribulose-5-phosphate 3-epimerase [Lachnospiraceae bacterium]|jgi:L-ribulose-5-phosphate 3-epimerase
MGRKYTIGMYEKAIPDLPWKEKLEAAKEAGYDFVEISIDASEEKISRVYMSKEERFELVRLMYETGMPIRTMNVSALTKYSLGDPDPEIEKRAVDIMIHAIELAEDLGVRIVMIPGYDIYFGESTPETQQRFIKNLRYGTEIAAKHSVLLDMETMENDFMNTSWKGMYYVNMIDSLYLGLYPDVGNMKNAAVKIGCDSADDLRSARGRIAALHLKETKPGKFRDMMYGEGHVDFETMIKTAWSLGCRKYVTEFWYHGEENWMERLVYGRKKMTDILDRQ